MRGLTQDCAAKTAEPPQVQQLLQAQEKHIQSLGGLLGTLEDRLRCVSRSEPSPNVSEEKCPQPVVSSVMDKIRENNRNINCCCERIQEMLRLLEV